MTININPIGDVTVNINTDQTSFNLLSNFDDPLTTGRVANFQLYNTSLGNGTINIVLFDQAGAGAPLTTQNFENYVNDGDYVNSIIHRSVQNFVIQGGGYTVEDRTPIPITTNPPVQNEFSPIRSNLRGTIAMAKQGGDPNSATSQWFFNLANNSSNLDNQNGGFTVFGQVLSSADLTTIDAIAAVPVFNPNQTFNSIPLFLDSANPTVNSPDNYVRFSQITVAQADELQFTLADNSNPDLVNVIINGQDILLDYLPNQIGSAEITIVATNLTGEQVQDTFTVTVIDPVFDPASYGASNPDLIPFYINAGYDLGFLTNHYLTSGRFEGRQVDTFDEYRYTASSYVTGGDLINTFGLNGVEATLHYINNGYVEGRPTTAFDPVRYLISYDDLRDAFGNDTAAGTQHFITNGFAPEGRNPSEFPSDRYLASYGDLITAFEYIPDYAAKIESASNHYLFNGLGERRQITFDPNAYLNANPDLIPFVPAGLDPTQHYILSGFAEGRPTA
ncbi:peptidylprolyl isomerase [Chroococcus sp. FPU101]|uniref:peptidylprolyl isomerase n=1 Tax=Chroococcus sp. FPU101 TaxID=1974212 RepID=UPI001A8C9CB7|nr:peptidylprolyl isomerase [Chroococcus sp. FPU101]GFE70618.1 hypothetical protein CFPU101_32280 [Chroococcus sp. FPU101]